METSPLYNSSDSRRQSKVSVDMLVRAFRGAWSRFPVTMVYVIYTTMWAIMYTLDIEDYINLDKAENVVAGLWYLGGVGFVFTLAVSLWCEYLSRRPLAYMIVANLLLFADTLYIMICGSELGESWGIARVAIVSALIVAIIFVPSRKDWAWNFSNSQVLAMLTAMTFAVASGIAIVIIFRTIYALFNVESFKCMLCVHEVVAVMLPVILFLHLIPGRDEVKRLSERFSATKFQCGTAKFFFLTLTVVYMAILYVYGLKILFTWTLPRGVVTWSVTGLTGAVLLTLFLLEGVRRTHPSDVLTLRAMRLLPMAMMPLFVLMSVGVLYRIGQYGLTVSRLYVLTFNIWCYVVFGYMILSRTRRFNGVAISFAVVFLLTSIFPYFNYTTLSNNMMRARLKQSLIEMGFTKFPVSEEEFVEAFSALPPKQRTDVKSKMEYLDDEKDHSLLEDITGATYYGGDDSYISEYFMFSDYNSEEDEGEMSRRRIELKNESEFVDIPVGYRLADYTRWHSDVSRWHSNASTFDKEGKTVVVNDITYSLPLDSLIQLDEKRPFSPVALHPLSGNGDTVFVANEIIFRYRVSEQEKKRELSTLELAGYIFAK